MKHLVAITILGTTLFFAAREMRDTYASYAAIESIPSSMFKIGEASRGLSRETSPVQTTPLAVANAFVDAHRERWQIQPYHELRPTVLPSGSSTTVRYGVFQDNILIIGLEIDVILNSHLGLESVENNYRPVVHVNFEQISVLAPGEVIRRNSQFLADRKSLELVSSLLYIDSVNVIPQLVYVIKMQDRSEPSQQWSVMFRAKDGQVLGKTQARQNS